MAGYQKPERIAGSAPTRRSALADYRAGWIESGLVGDAHRKIRAVCKAAGRWFDRSAVRGLRTGCLRLVPGRRFDWVVAWAPLQARDRLHEERRQQDSGSRGFA